MKKLTSILDELKVVHTEIVKLKNIKRDTRGSNTTHVKVYKDMQVALNNILYSLSTDLKDINKHISFALTLLSDCINHEKPTNDELFINYESYIYGSIELVKEEIEKIKEYNVQK